MTEAHRTVLIRDACERNPLPDEQAAREKPVVAAAAVHRAPRLVLQEMCLAIRSSVKPGAMAGAPADSVTPSNVPTKEMCPIG